MDDYDAVSLTNELSEVENLGVCRLGLFSDVFRLYEERRRAGINVSSPIELGIAEGAYRALKLYLDNYDVFFRDKKERERWLSIIRKTVDWLDETYAFSALEQLEEEQRR